MQASLFIMFVLRRFIYIIITEVLLQLIKGSNTINNVLLCENSTAEIVCQNKTLIAEVNISSTSYDNVSLPTSSRNDNQAFTNDTITNECIGSSSCNISSTDIDYTQITDATFKIDVSYTCFRSGHHANVKYAKNIYPYNVRSIHCRTLRRPVKINVVHIYHERALCPDQQCENIITETIQRSCNDRRYCIDNETDSQITLFDKCVRVKKAVNITYSCTDEKRTIPQTDSLFTAKLSGIIVCVSGGFIIVILVSLFLVKRSKTKGNKGIVTCNHHYSNTQTNVAAVNDVADSYTTLQQTKDESDYMRLNNMTPNLNSTNDHYYMDVS